MSKLYLYVGFSIFFYSNDHLPIHVHVKKGERITKFIFEYNGDVLTIKQKRAGNAKMLESNDRKKIEEFLYIKQKDVMKKWEQVFIYNNKITCEKIQN